MLWQKSVCPPAGTYFFIYLKTSKNIWHNVKTTIKIVHETLRRSQDIKTPRLMYIWQIFVKTQSPRQTRLMYDCKIFIHWNLLATVRVSYRWPAAHSPVCIPMRSLSVSSGRWWIVKRDTWSSRSRAILQIFKLCKGKDALQPLSHRPISLKVSNNAILQISAMCRPSLGFGNPLTTMYASPIVSTWQHL